MQNSPLQLEKSFFTAVSIRANRDGSPDAKWNVQTIPEVLKQGDEKRKWAVSLRVILKSIDDLKPCYNAEVEIAGTFSVAPTWPEANIEQLVHINGCPVLYSAAREMISNLTSRGPWPMLVLPTVSFADYAPKPPTAPTQTKAPPQAKK